MTESGTDQAGYRDAEIHLHDCSGDTPLFFSTPEREGLTEQLLHLVQFGEGLPVLVGGAGIGKSTLLSHLAKRLGQADFCAHIELSGATRLAQALNALLTSFGVKPKVGAGELLAQVRHFAQQLASEQMKAVLLLDNAHFLDDAALGAIISLLQGNDSPGYGLQFVFACKLGLVERMDALELVDVPVYDFTVPPLSSSQLSDFLLAREFSGEKSALLSRSDVTRIWGKTLGNPGLSLSLVGSIDARPSPKVFLPAIPDIIKGVPLGHVIAMTLLVSVLLWALLVREDAPESHIMEIPVAPAAQPKSGDNVAPGSRSDTLRPEASLDSLREDSSESDVSVELSPTSSSENAGGDGGDVVMPSPEVETSIPPVVAPVPSAAVAVSVPTPDAAVLPNNPPQPSPDPGSDSLTEDERFLLSRADSEYSLQVMVASQKPALQSFVMRQSNRDNLYIYEVNRNGRRLFVVLTGVYSSKEKALLARNSLPEEQKNAGPWPRSLADIKREINDIRR